MMQEHRKALQSVGPERLDSVDLYANSYGEVIKSRGPWTLCPPQFLCLCIIVLRSTLNEIHFFALLKPPYAWKIVQLKSSYNAFVLLQQQCTFVKTQKSFNHLKFTCSSTWSSMYICVSYSESTSICTMYIANQLQLKHNSCRIVLIIFTFLVILQQVMPISQLFTIYICSLILQGHRKVFIT